MARSTKLEKMGEPKLLPFPTRLRELMDKGGRGEQERLAAYMKVNRQSIGQWKDGKTFPDINALILMAEYFKASTDYLLGRNNVKSIDANHIVVNIITGLSDEAINILETTYSEGKNNSITRTINKLIEDKEVLNYISKYLYYDLVTEYETTDDKAMATINFKYKYKDDSAFNDDSNRIDADADTIILRQNEAKGIFLIKMQNALARMEEWENLKPEIE